MKRRWWALAALAVVLAAAIGGTLYLRRPAPGPSRVVGNRIELATREQSMLVKVRLSDRPEGTLELEKKGDAWTVPAAPAAVLDSSAVADLAYHFWSLTAERAIEDDPSDLSQYGLAPPRARAEGTFSDGTSLVLLLGDLTPMKDACYLQVQGDPKLYTVWTVVGEHLRWTLADLRDRTITPAVNATEIMSLSVRRADGSVLEIVQKSPEEAQSSRYGFGRYMVVRPYRVPRSLDGEQGQALFAAAAGVGIEEFVDDNPKDLSAYGLVRPWAELVTRDKESTLRLRFGARRTDGKRFFRVGDRPNVYAVSEASLAFLDTPAFSLVEKFVFIPNIDDVDRIDITAGGATHVLAISHSPQPPAADGEEPQVTESFTVDGKQVTDEAFRSFYQRLIGLLVDGELRNPPPTVLAASPEVRARFRLNKGDPAEVVVSYLPFDRDFYAVSVQGICEFAISRGQVEGVRDILGRLVAGESITE